MAKYQPGQGLSRDSTERLRARKSEQSNLPAVDESIQWDSLLGAGASKKTRCGHCTRPLSQHELGGGHFICSRCTSAAAKESPPLRSSRTYASALVQCTTPSSTRLTSDCSGRSAVESPRSDISHATTNAEREPPTSQDVWIAALRRGLEGEWVGQDDERYNVQFDDNSCFTCHFRDARQIRSVLLHVDLHSNKIWWGEDRSHTLDADEVYRASDHITWRPRGPGSRQEFVWERRLTCSLNVIPVEVQQVQKWKPSLRAEASVFVPMASPSNNGGVAETPTCRSKSLRAAADPYEPCVSTAVQPFVSSLRADACLFVPASAS